MIRSVGRYPFEEVKTTGIHKVLSLIAWSVVDTAVIDQSYTDEEVLRAYTWTWEEVGKTLLE